MLVNNRTHAGVSENPTGDGIRYRAETSTSNISELSGHASPPGQLLIGVGSQARVSCAIAQGEFTQHQVLPLCPLSPLFLDPACLSVVSPERIGVGKEKNHPRLLTAPGFCQAPPPPILAGYKQALRVEVPAAV